MRRTSSNVAHVTILLSKYTILYGTLVVKIESVARRWRANDLYPLYVVLIQVGIWRQVILQ